MRSPCTTLLNRFKADSNDSLSSTMTRVKKLTPLWLRFAGEIITACVKAVNKPIGPRRPPVYADGRAVVRSAP
jgi:hypothetical protein